jgi:hypothetical protein
MMDWRGELEANLKALKYGFMPGAEGTELPEAIDRILLAVSEFRKEAFFAGYKAGAQDAAMDLGVSFDEGLGRVGAERRYNEFSLGGTRD